MSLKIHRTSILFSLILLTSSSTLSQPLAEKVKTPAGIACTEELVIHTDKDIYIAGENVFLKIYKLNRLTRTPGNISKVVYINLSDNFNNPVVQLKAEVNGFSASGEFRLPDTLRTGNYLIRSCTNWMQNFSGDLFSYKRISVINPFEKIDRIKIPFKGQLPDSVAFYPESGSLVSGIETLVGYRCFSVNGNPAGVKGFVIENDRDTLCAIQADNSGTGFFSIKPSANSSIDFIAKDNHDKTKKFKLPAVHDSGFVFSVNESRDRDLFEIRVQNNSSITYDRGKMYLVYSPVSITSFKKEITLEETTEILLKKDTLPAGLARIMIVDEGGIPLAKRWICNDKSSEINYSISLQNPVYPTRGKVKIDITATDPDGNPVKSDLLVRVVKSFSIDKANCGNLPGIMQIPSLAVVNTDFEHSDMNDYLLFYSDENDLLRNDEKGFDEMHPSLPELGGHIVSGTIRNPETGKPLVNENIVLSFVGKTARCSFSRTDDSGCFNFVVREYGTKEIVIQPLSPGLKDYYVELNNPFPDALNRFKPSPFYPDSTRLEEINSAIISMQIRNIYEPFLKNGTIGTENMIRPDFYGESAETILISSFIELASLKEVIKEIVPGVSINKDNGKSNFRITNDHMEPAFGTDPLVLVDGVPITDIDKILIIRPRDMEKIEILKSRYFISDITLEGIIHFITKKGNLSDLEFDRSVFRQELETLQGVNRSGFPDYPVDSLKNSRIPDFRNTLYWNPDLITDGSGKTTVEFYTSDESGEYTIIAEGMTSDGKTGKSEKTLLVKGN